MFTSRFVMKGTISMFGGTSIASRPFLIFLYCGLVVGVAGCGGKAGVIPLKGQLTLDGEPYGPGNLILIPASRQGGAPGQTAYGSADAEGGIVFQTFESGDGVPIGVYRVMVTPTGSAPPSPLVYQNEQTPLTVSVDSDLTELKIDLVSSAGPMAGPTAPGGFVGGADPSNIEAIMKQATKAARPLSE
jgi:hypothetical protein